MRYNKVRGILRAKQGSQIPKFHYGNFIQGPGGMMQDGFNNRLDNILYSHLTNPYNTGSLQPSSIYVPSISNQIGSNPIGDQTQNNIESAHNYINNNLDSKGNLNVMQESLSSIDQIKNASSKSWNLPTTIPNNARFKPSFGQKLGVIGKGLGKKVGNFANENQDLIIGGVDYLSDKLFGGTKNSSEYDTIIGGAKTLRNNLKGPAKWWATAGIAAVEGLNKIGASTVDDTYINQDFANKAGGSYTGTIALGEKAMANNGIEFGLFNRGGYRSAKRTRNKFLTQQGIATGIVNEASDQRAMINDLNYLNYNSNINGIVTDPLTYRALSAKQGGTLDTKINLVKSRKFNQIVNIDTKQVEEFKEGGNLPELWEPIIDDISDYWEPIIDDIESYREGGKTKEELEIPEIEETTQKNLIPEGALHKNKHHMEHTEGLTQKGIPVIDNDGEQQAEIELDEIIFTLEVTKKLEELYEDGSDEAAIEAGKLLVKEILFNTDDRTGLIAKCQEGGKL